ncbi:MAG TPA: methylaspartate mutase subunit E [Thermoanaerobaculia bacterium]|nr:methylaspartate mutase subunit E [Thermoanaerobaculia bacterium]
MRTKRTAGHRILLGGIGGDSHSVGLHILHQALTANGYRVEFLGIQNRVEDIVRRSAEFDVVMISNMDGHAAQYLEGFVRPAAPAGRRGPLWYLGGNLTIGEADGWREHFERLGFDRVHVKFVDLATLLEHLAQDLRGVQPADTVWGRPAGPLLPEEKFLAQRDEVLAGWETGAAARSIDDNAAFLREQPSFPALLADAQAGRRPMLIQPRSGVPGLAEQIELFRQFRDAGCPGLSFQVDSMTRNNNYAGAAEAIATSARTGRATLNGFPVINHGVDGVRRVVSEVGVALQTRHSTRDPRLLAEISYAGGATAFEGGAICYNIPYYKDFPVRDSIARWRYVDRLTGLYHERHGIVLDREFFGTLTAALIAPAIALTTNIVESVLAAEQGVKCVSPAYAEQGNRAQDIAAIRVMGSLTREILAEQGYGDVQVYTCFHQYMAAFPPSQRPAEELIFASAVTAALAGADRLINKSPVESRKIPTAADNLRGIELAQLGMASAHHYRLSATAEAAVAEEERILRREVRAIFDSLLDAGRGDLAAGVARGFELGLIDIPFAPSVHNRGEVRTARDVNGAVRFLSPGNLRLDPEVREFHQTRMDERRRAEGLASREQDYLLVESDVLRIAREQHGAWPLDADAAEPAFHDLYPERAIA